jgi:hypothetical protein
VEAFWTEEGPIMQIIEMDRQAFTNPEFRARLGQCPSSAVGSPHLFRKVAVPGICVAC